MQKSSITVTLVCSLAIAAASCARNPKTAQTTQTTQPNQTTQATKTIKSCPPLFQLGSIQLLGCVVDSNHLLGVGNPHPPAIPKGTTIFFTAKLENAGAYCATVPAPRPIPPHLFVTITGQPLFDDDAPCQAWREVPPVLHQ